MLNISSIEEIIKQNKYIHLKIYGLIYKIELNDNLYTIYLILYKDKKKEYNSLKQLFNEYTIYNGNLSDNINRIKIITDEEVK